MFVCLFVGRDGFERGCGDLAGWVGGGGGGGYWCFWEGWVGCLARSGVGCWMMEVLGVEGISFIDLEREGRGKLGGRAE